MDHEELHARFVYYPPDDEKRVKHESVRGRITEVAHSLNALIPDGREKSIVMTKLEEAMFWANAALARQSP